MLQEVGYVLEERPLVLRCDLGKLAQKLAAHSNRQRPSLQIQVKMAPPLAEQEVFPCSA